MATLLHINVSPRGHYSISCQLGNAAVAAWKKKNPGGRVIERDLTKTALTFVDLDWIAGAFTPPEQHNETHKRALALSDELIAELVAADEIILATPMYNFAAPAALKAWIDHVVRAGKTFRYSSAGVPEGLLAGKNKKLLAIIASGGSYTEAALSPYLRSVFGFIGITDVHIAQAGGTAALQQGSVFRLISRKSPQPSEKTDGAKRRLAVSHSVSTLLKGNRINFPCYFSTNRGNP